MRRNPYTSKALRTRHTLYSSSSRRQFSGKIRRFGRDRRHIPLSSLVPVLTLQREIEDTDMSMIGQFEKPASSIPLSPRKSPMIRPHSPAGQPLPSGNTSSSNSHHVIIRSTSDGMCYSSPDLWRLRANSLHNDLVTPVPPSPFRSRSASESSSSIPPLVPWLGNPPLSPASTTAAANAALAASEHERNRAAQQQKLEESMSAEELRSVLKRERAYSCKLAVDLATLRSAAVSSQAEAEAYEEGRINCLMRRLSSLAKEKGRLIVELEQEEEMLTNTMQRKLDELRKEKALLEKQIEKEHSAQPSNSS